MRKIFYFFSIMVITSLMTSCLGMMTAELTDAEKSRLIEKGRKFVITVNHLGISSDDKIFVKTNTPKLSLQYNGYKSGTAKMVWKINPSYSIRVICKGDLLDTSCPIRLSVTRFE